MTNSEFPYQINQLAFAGSDSNYWLTVIIIVASVCAAIIIGLIVAVIVLNAKRRKHLELKDNLANVTLANNAPARPATKPTLPPRRPAKIPSRPALIGRKAR